MSSRRSRGGPPGPLTFLFAAALLAGLLVAWEPRYWHTAVAVVAISLTGVAWAITARRVELPWQTGLVLLIAAWGPIQLAAGASVVPSLTLRAAVAWGACVAAFLPAADALRRRTDRDFFLQFLMWAFTALAADALLQSHSAPIRVFGLIPAEASVVGTMFYKNQFAALMELAAPLALWRVMKGKVLEGTLCYAIIFAATVTSLSRAGTILVLAELFVFLGAVVATKELPVKPALGLAAALLLALAGASLVAGVDDLWNRMQEANPFHLREQLTTATIHMAGEKPLFGWGLGTWRVVYPQFATVDPGVIVNEAHNDLAQWAAEGGMPFLLLVVALPLSVAWRALRSVWGIGVLSVMVHCWVDYPMHEPALALVWFALAGILSQNGNPEGVMNGPSIP